MVYYRDKRTASLLKKEISRLLLREVKDPRITGLITVTDVVVSKDLKVATVYISILGDKKTIEDSLAGLSSSRGYIKTCLAKVLHMKYMPDIRFKEDYSLKKGAELYNKLNKLKLESKNKEIKE